MAFRLAPGISTVLLLAMVVALGPLSTDLYLPALPAIRDAFGGSEVDSQLTLSVFLVGFAFAQLLWGPISDRVGRRPTVAVGLAIFIAASLWCAHANSLNELLLGRFIQAIGVCAAPVAGRATIRDLYSGKEAARMFAFLGVAMGIAPAIAPTIGGLIIYWGDWQDCFLFLSVIGLIAFFSYRRNMKETVSVAQRSQPMSFSRMVASYASLLADKRYLAYVACQTAIFAGLFSYIAGMPYVMTDVVGLAAHHFGWVFGISILAFISGSMISGLAARKFESIQILTIGIGILVTAAGIGEGFALARDFRASAIVVPFALYALGCGMSLPQTMAGAMENFPEIAGSASAFIGFVQMIVAAGAGLLVTATYNGTSLSMTGTVALSAIFLAGSFTLLLTARHQAKYKSGIR